MKKILVAIVVTPLSMLPADPNNIQYSIESLKWKLVLEPNNAWLWLYICNAVSTCNYPSRNKAMQVNLYKAIREPGWWDQILAEELSAKKCHCFEFFLRQASTSQYLVYSFFLSRIVNYMYSKLEEPFSLAKGVLLENLSMIDPFNIRLWS